ncbi:glycosyltransferase [Cryobacterium sp. Hh7]|uniref:glycosyltransferase n=1 Tax=Cryobacterium sp. Hh7 TaxID=1259159 RepID=UPI00106A82FE|nr:glycosyltransferase [Cryobacterium sp. Hh7]TFD51765.1 glycosyltransferase [Cryobacterium sp. Hh7]
MRDRNAVMAVVPVFNPDESFPDRILELLRQVDAVIVVDDGSSKSNSWETTLLGQAGISIQRQENLGIAAALNAGIATALTMDPNVEFILTVDQDSGLCNDYVSRAVRQYRDAVRAGVSVGSVCAEQFNDWRVSPRREVRGIKTSLEIAQSGMLIPTSSFRHFGTFSETLFIDCVDTEFVLRMLREDTLVIIGAGCCMSHEVGTTVDVQIFNRKVKVLGRELKFSYHTPLRRYYISRNRMVLYREYFWTDPVWNAREIIVEARTTMLSLLFGPAKSKQARALFLGLLDGLRGKVGKASLSRQLALAGPQ